MSKPDAKYRALVSVSDKASLEHLTPLDRSPDWEIVSTGGTAEALKQAGIQVTPIDDLTGMPEMMGGRLKTLHPLVHGPILARPQTGDLSALSAYAATLPSSHGGLSRIVPLRLIAVNFYPFVKAVERFKRGGAGTPEVIENIDIGGPAMVRSAAKACHDNDGPLIVVNPARYEEAVAALLAGPVGRALRLSLIKDAFRATKDYDAAVVDWFIGMKS
jgi:phosphoribosylaminoimidazolecarboxamide formyltransferase / IMP cyclohydrolase